MPFLYPGTEVLSRLIIYVLGAVTVIQIGNVIYEDPQLSLTIAAGAHRDPIGVLDYFMNPFSSSSCSGFVSESRTESDDSKHVYTSASAAIPSAQKEPHTVTAIESNVPPSEYANLIDTILTKLQRHTKTSASYCSIHLAEPQCLSRSGPGDAQQGQTIEQSPETVTSTSTSVSHNGATYTASGELAVISQKAIPATTRPLNLIVDFFVRCFWTYLHLLSETQTRNTLILVVALTIIFTRELMLRKWNIQKLEICKAANDEANAKAKSEIDDLRRQLGLSKKQVTTHKETTRKLQQAHQNTIEKIQKERFAAEIETTKQIIRLDIEARYKNDEIKKLKAEALSLEDKNKDDKNEIEQLKSEKKIDALNRHTEQQHLSSKVKTAEGQLAELKSKFLASASRNVELSSRLGIQREMVSNSIRRERTYKIAGQYIQSKMNKSVDHLNSQIKQKDEIVKGHTETIHGHAETIQGLKKALKGCEEKIEPIRTASQNDECRVKEFEKEKNELLTKNKTLEDDLNVERSKLKALDSQLKTLSSTAYNQKKKIARLESAAEIPAINANMMAADLQAERDKVKELEGRIQDFQIKSDGLTEQLDSEKKEVEALGIRRDNVIEELYTVTGELNTQIDDLKKENGRLMGDIRAKDSQISQLENAKPKLTIRPIQPISNIDPTLTKSESPITSANRKSPSTLAIHIQQQNKLSESVETIQHWLENKCCGICGSPDHISTYCPKRLGEIPPTIPKVSTQKPSNIVKKPERKDEKKSESSDEEKSEEKGKKKRHHRGKGKGKGQNNGNEKKEEK